MERIRPSSVLEICIYKAKNVLVWEFKMFNSKGFFFKNEKGKAGKLLYELAKGYQGMIDSSLGSNPK